jgi:hypothetical protein
MMAIAQRHGRHAFRRPVHTNLGFFSIISLQNDIVSLTCK